MNRQKQKEIKGFLGWLEGCMGIIGGGPHAQDRSSQGAACVSRVVPR